MAFRSLISRLQNHANHVRFQRLSTASSMRTVKWNTEYYLGQMILTVGDGDFSFSSALATALKDGYLMIATSYDEKVEVRVKYVKAKENITNLINLGARVYHGVDATRMMTDPRLSGIRFDCIIYNFPHSGFRKGGESHPQVIRSHASLVGMFFKNAACMLTEHGEIHVTHKSKNPYAEWGIRKLGEDAGLELIDCSPFYIEQYPGYSNKRGDGYDADAEFYLGDCEKFKFMVKKV